MARTLTFGHRGVGCSIPGTMALLPENSITSFREARRLGAEGVELDVFLSKNSEILVIHGHLSTNSLCLTALGRDGAGVRRFGVEDLVEKHDIRASDLLLKRPWRLLQQVSDVEQLLQQHRRDVKASFQEYIDSAEVFEGDRVPTLEEVFEELGDSLQYNIELKGFHPEVGPRVLDVMERYPKIKAVISSFQWLPPQMEPGATYADQELERLPNGEMTVDLLRPLVNNRLGVPLGLLFNNERCELPSIGRIVECARSYGAEWINVAHNFWKMKEPIIGCEKTGLESLHHLVSEMHRHGLKLMTYFLESELDSADDVAAQRDAGVDAICPNDVELAMKVMKQ
ncbi:glycerophosphoryl diester phosphodiesterase [Babesia caballi]|uniref:Glycerophosphoryl diester phosphodiesterase n=1 Tax=Babesia caballi TaxID=5871 RepID=A0AAV4LT37_BABCB|nr:glycerophosphoryl diester phosphodiesterase [Babesia caballi]